MEKVRDFIFLGYKITADGDYSHEIKRCLLFRRQAMTDLDGVLKSRDIALLTKVSIIKAMNFLIVVWMWQLDRKGSWAPKNWCFQTVVLEKALEKSLDNKEIKPVNPKRNKPWFGRAGAEAETPIFWPPDARSWLIEKETDGGKIEGKVRKRQQRMR